MKSTLMTRVCLWWQASPVVMWGLECVFVVSIVLMSAVVWAQDEVAPEAVQDGAMQSEIADVVAKDVVEAIVEGAEQVEAQQPTGEEVVPRFGGGGLALPVHGAKAPTGDEGRASLLPSQETQVIVTQPVPPPAAVIEPEKVSPLPSLEPLNFGETEALSLSEKWRERYIPPILGRNGRVFYHYGESIARVLTSPLNVTDIVFEKGEVIVENGLYIGDSINWNILPVAQQTDEGLITHLIVKPFYANLETTLTVLTDRRTYYIYLRSTLDRFMSAVGFQYPDSERDALVGYQLAVSQQAALAQQAQAAIDVPRESGQGTQRAQVDELNFNFKLTGDNPVWRPVRVYSSENKTYIQMPKRMRHREAPVFLEIGDEGRQLVNYRLQGTTFVVDKIIEKGVLLAGAGKKQAVVYIDGRGDKSE